MFLRVSCLDCGISYALNIGVTSKETAQQAANRVKCSVCLTPAFAEVSETGDGARTVEPKDGINIMAILSGAKPDVQPNMVKLDWNNVYRYFVQASNVSMQSSTQPWKCKGCDRIVSSVENIRNKRDPKGGLLTAHVLDQVGLPCLHDCKDSGILFTP